MSTRPRIYLDWSASAPLAEAARAAMTDAMAELANPSSVHAEGRRARDRVETARRHVADLVGRPREQLIFTSGGTEANQLGVRALAAAAERRGLPHVVATTPLEHPSLKGAIAALGWKIVMLPTDEPVGVVAAALVNHELGTILDAPLPAGALVHLDVVQAAGKLDLRQVVADSLAVSAHKIGGPQGAGALVLSTDEGLSLDTEQAGHQERGRRPGTENLVGIVGFGAAAAAVDPTVGTVVAGVSQLAAWADVAALGDRLERGILAIPATRIHGADLPRVGGIVNAGFSGARGQDLVIALDLAGIAASTGAACTSGSVKPSEVLLGLGMAPEQALEAVRFSLGPTTSEAQIDEVLRTLAGVVERARLHR